MPGTDLRFAAALVAVGDCVLMRPSDSDKLPYVARVEKIEADHRGNVRVRVRWYYRPEESIGGRSQFHGAKELFLSDHYDEQSAHTIEGKCTVHSFKNYTKLENVGAEDYFCRFEYKAATGGFTPDRVAVYVDNFFSFCRLYYDCGGSIIITHFSIWHSSLLKILQMRDALQPWWSHGSVWRMQGLVSYLLIIFTACQHIFLKTFWVHEAITIDLYAKPFDKQNV